MPGSLSLQATTLGVQVAIGGQIGLSAYRRRDVGSAIVIDSEKQRGLHVLEGWRSAGQDLHGSTEVVRGVRKPSLMVHSSLLVSRRPAVFSLLRGRV